MPSLKEIKDRISIVVTTRKITKAMELVAASKIGRMQRNLASVNEYTKTVREIFYGINAREPRFLAKKLGGERQFFVLIASDLGLCGAYNANLVKHFATEAQMSSRDLVVVGSKALLLAKTKELPVLASYVRIGDELNYDVAKEIGHLAAKRISEGKINSVNIIYTKFVNTLTYIPVTFEILPTPSEEIKTATLPTSVEISPSASDSIMAMLRMYIGSEVYRAMAESKVSEMCSRRTAMETASDNAMDLINELNLTYNRIRQAKITQEISEIVAGSEA